MWHRSCASTGVSFNTLMRGFFREGRYKEGIKIAREMLELGVGLSVASMEILIGGLCRGGEALKAAEVFVEFFGDMVVPEGFDCLDLVESLCHVGSVEKAVEVVELVLERNRALFLERPCRCNSFGVCDDGGEAGCGVPVDGQDGRGWDCSGYHFL